MKDKIQSIILDVIEEINEDLGRAQKVAVDRGADAPIFGKNGALDSLSLVSLVVAVEQAINDELNVNVSLADNRAMSQKSSPFRTVGTLTDYAWRQIEQAGDA